MKRLRKILCLVVVLFMHIPAFAHDCYINGIYYNLNSDNKTLTVTSKYSSSSGSYSGIVNIPSSVTIASKTYKVTSIGSRAFDGCSRLTSITIGNSITSIYWRAFDGCTSLTNVTIPNSVTSIGNAAFFGCTSLKTVTIGNSVTSIGDGAFSGCTSLTSIEIPNSVTSLGSYAFMGCTSLTSVTIGDSVTSIGGAFSGCTSLINVTIPNSVTSIDSAAFKDCKHLEIINLPSNITNIDAEAFEGCTSLTTVNIPNTVKSIGNNAFKNCIKLNVKLPINLVSLGSWAFAGCFNIKDTLTIPKKVDQIGKSAFYNCVEINTVIMLGSCPTIYEYRPFGNYLKTIYVPCGEKYFYELANYWTYLSSLIQDKFPYDINGNSFDTTYGNVSVIQPTCSDSLAHITAIADEGYHFTYWNDGNTDNPREIYVTQDSSFTAYFAIDTLNLVLKTNNQQMGSVVGNQGLFEYGSSIKVSAVANEHYHFVKWSDGNIQNPRQIVLTQDTILTAIFEIDNHTVTLKVNKDEFGNVTGSGVYDYNSQVTVSANAVKGYHFVMWNDGNTNNPRSIILTQDTVFTAIFEIDTFFVTVKSNDDAAGTVNGSGIYDYHSEIIIFATANTHYHFVSWSDGNTSNPRMVTIDKDTVFIAQFKEDNKYNIQVLSNDNTMGSAEGGGIYYEGEQIQINATANSDYIFKEWSDGNSDNPRIITVLSDNVYIANFEKESSLQDISDLQQIQIYPNPAKDIITLDVGDLTLDINNELFIINTIGQVVYSSNIQSQIFNIDIRKLQSGVYYIRLIGVENSKVFKLIKE